MTPKDVVPNCVPGLANCTRLKVLKLSNRNCAVILSLIRKFFDNDKSVLSMPGVRTSGSVAGALPYVNAAGSENAEVSKYCRTRLAVDPLNAANG